MTDHTSCSVYDLIEEMFLSCIFVNSVEQLIECKTSKKFHPGLILFSTTTLQRTTWIVEVINFQEKLVMRSPNERLFH